MYTLFISVFLFLSFLCVSLSHEQWKCECVEHTGDVDVDSTVSKQVVWFVCSEGRKVRQSWCHTCFSRCFASM